MLVWTRLGEGLYRCSFCNRAVAFLVEPVHVAGPTDFACWSPLFEHLDFGCLSRVLAS